MYLHFIIIIMHSVSIKDWSQIFFGLWRNKLKNVVYTV
jgi:hypothetical protein